MNGKIRSILIGVSLGLSVSAWAQEQSPSPELLARLDLERMRDETDWKLRTVTGGYKGLWLLHERKLRRIHEQLQAGRSVEAKNVEALIKEHSRLMP